ncbi:MAG: UbiA family prenyltransferase [Bacteroidota bacterium]
MEQEQVHVWQKWKDAFILLRIPFSIYLMPIFWFSLSESHPFHVSDALKVFLIIHLFLYPASNGYNSYFDRDEESIGGLSKPPKVSTKLFYLVSLWDILTLTLSLTISFPFFFMILGYKLISKAYSYPPIRLKKFPLLSTLSVTAFQGAFTFLMVQVGLYKSWNLIWESVNMQFALISTLFLLGSYPLTQVYQHKEDGQRGDRTLSLSLGIRGTFIFSGIFLTLSTAYMLGLFAMEANYWKIISFLVLSVPISFFFLSWARKVWKNTAFADHLHAMRMNQISSLCFSSIFILIILIEWQTTTSWW